MDVIWIVVIAVVAAVLIGAVLLATRQRRSHRLQERFGPEYERVTAESRSEGEQELLRREERVEELEIRPLSPGAQQRYIDEWRSAQAGFVDDPETAVSQADGIVRRMLSERGFPVDGDREQLAADVSVHRPDVVQRYRHGHELVAADADGERTENLRQAMTDFRAVLEEMIDDATERARIDG